MTTPNNNASSFIETNLDNYDIQREIGRGSFSIVKEAIDLRTGETVAIKTISKKFITKKGWANLCREIDIMVHLSHPNILKIKSVVDTPSQVHLILEYIEGGELFEQIVSRGSYGEKDARKIVKQILGGIAYLHDLGVAHRDLKPENLLCSVPDDRVVVCDFGLAKVFGRGELLKTHCGTPHYAAPEIVRGDPTYDKAVDMWSIGVIAFVLLSGCFPFHSDDEEILKYQIIHAQFTFPPTQWSHISETAKDFIRSLLRVDPSKRMTAPQAVAHPWLQDESVTNNLNLRASLDQYMRRRPGKEVYSNGGNNHSAANMNSTVTFEDDGEEDEEMDQ